MKKIVRFFLMLSFVLFIVSSCESEDPFEIDPPEKPIEKPEEPKEPEPEEPDPEESSGHPFLIVTKDMYPALREKSSQEPWKSMKADAIARSHRKFNSSNTAELNEYLGAAALAYILDEENAKTHAENVRDVIGARIPLLRTGTSWDGVVPRMGALFVATLALDIVYDALTSFEIAGCESVISAQIADVPIEGSWADARRGTHGTWNIYKGYRTTPDDAYYQGIMVQVTPDGVSPVTPTYGWARVGGSDNEVSKSGYMDVLEFTGIDKRYYNNARLQKFQRWLYGSSVNCAKDYIIIGDMLPTSKVYPALLHWRVGNYDSTAAGYAAWLHEGKTPIGHILTYIVPKSALPTPIVPSSQIYENGGAFLRDKEDDSNGLQLTLYNIKSQDEWHTHNEVNGLSLSGLGNRLLVNGGRLGSPVRPAYLNNTLTINGSNHSSRLGGGILEGFVSDDLDFAVGSAGPALPNASHLRNSILVHSGSAPGYFILFDEVSGSKGNTVKNYLHPANESSVDVVSRLTEYTAKIDHYPTVQNVSAGFYYLTPPKEVKVEKVLSSDPASYPSYPRHNRLESVYDVDVNGNKNLATIIYPFSTTVSKANFERIEGENMNACTVSHSNNTTDYIFETMSAQEISSSGMSFKADFCLVRKTGNKTSFYFVRNGASLTSDKLGFQSDKAITIYANGTEGKIIGSGATVRLMGPGMGNVIFTPSAEKISSSADFIEVKLGKGTYSFQ